MTEILMTAFLHLIEANRQCYRVQKKDIVFSYNKHTVKFEKVRDECQSGYKERERGIIYTINIMIEFYIEFVVSAAKPSFVSCFSFSTSRKKIISLNQGFYGYQI